MNSSAYQRIANEIQKDVMQQVQAAVQSIVGNDPIAVITSKSFAERVGVTEHVVIGWINKGYIPSVKIGKRRLVNHAALTAECLQKDAHLTSI